MPGNSSVFRGYFSAKKPDRQDMGALGRRLRLAGAASQQRLDPEFNVALRQLLFDGSLFQLIRQAQDGRNHLVQLEHLASQAFHFSALRGREFPTFPSAQLLIEESQVALLDGKDVDHASVK